MRTTITLDADVEALVSKAMRERNVSFKQAVNDALRSGLTESGDAEPYEVPTYNLGARMNLDKALQLAGHLEDEEALRKMQMGK